MPPPNLMPKPHAHPPGLPLCPPDCYSRQAAPAASVVATDDEDKPLPTLAMVSHTCVPASVRRGCVQYPTCVCVCGGEGVEGERNPSTCMRVEDGGGGGG